MPNADRHTIERKIHLKIIDVPFLKLPTESDPDAEGERECLLGLVSGDDSEDASGEDLFNGIFGGIPSLKREDLRRPSKPRGAKGGLS